MVRLEILRAHLQLDELKNIRCKTNSMKRIYIALLAITVVSCKHRNSSSTVIPVFTATESLNEVDESIREVSQKKDLTIAITIEAGILGPYDHVVKMLYLKDDTWEKIEIRKGASEIDTLYSDREGDIVEKQMILTMRCRKQDAETFFKKLISYNLFTIDEEKQLIKKCAEVRADHKTPEYIDTDHTRIYIIQGSLVRNLNYETYMREEDCPNIREWTDIKNIEKLFQEEWYAKEH